MDPKDAANARSAIDALQQAINALTLPMYARLLVRCGVKAPFIYRNAIG